jgi:hypothetical protein
MIVVTALLAGIVGASVVTTPVEQDAPQAMVGLSVDTADDQVEVEHVGGDRLDSDRIKISWTIADTRVVSETATAEQTLTAGNAVAFTFDGVTDSTGAWDQYDSPGNVTISTGDQIEVTLYDTATNKPVVTQSVVAGSSGGVDAPVHTDDLLWMHDTTAGATNVQMEVQFEIQPGSSTVGNSLNSVETDVQSGSPDMFSGTTQSDAARVGVDTDGDGTIENDIQSDINGWTVSNGGSTLTVEFTGSAYTNPQAGETIVAVVDNVDNPSSAGTYDVQIQTSGDGNWQSGNITVS